MNALNLPFNSTSFGNVSFAIAREIYKRGFSPNIFPIGQPDLSAQKEDNDFVMWLQSCVNKAPKHHDRRKHKTLKLWHLNQSLDSYSKSQGLFFFHETTDPTETEINAVNNQDVTFTSSKYTQKTFTEYDAKNVVYAPLGFDSFNLRKTNKDYLGNDIIVFGIMGKMESRKNTLRIIKLWSEKFGNNPKYKLDCLIWNHFLPPEQQEAAIVQALGGKRFHNITFYPWLQKNSEVNEWINHIDIDLTGLSGMEGFNLPAFNSLCLGKWGVFLNAHVHLDYANNENAILVQPTKMRQAVDGLFFHQGQQFSQGSWFDCEDEAIVVGMEASLLKAKTPNTEGEKLKDEFTYSKMVDVILENMEKL